MTEWMDLGGQYFNNVSASNSPVRTATALSRSAFDANVYPVIKANCVICHQPTGNSGAAQTGQSYLRNRYVLTGDAEGDYNVTLTMVSNACNASTVASNALLQRPSTVPHPAGAIGQTDSRAACGQRRLQRDRDLDQHRMQHAMTLQVRAFDHARQAGQHDRGRPGRFSAGRMRRRGQSARQPADGAEPDARRAGRSCRSSTSRSASSRSS